MEGVQLSPARRAQLDRAADDLIERAVGASEHLRSSPSSLDGWRLVRQKAGLRVYRPQGAASPGAREPVPLLGTGRIAGTVEDAIVGTYADSTAALRTSKALLSDKLLDGAVLQVLVANPPTSGVVFAGVKWFALKAPVGGQIIRDRDLLLYERQGRIVDRCGRFFAYHVYHSIDLPEWQSAPKDPGLARAFMSMCYLYSDADSSSSDAGKDVDAASPAAMDCFILGHFHPGGSVPPALGAFVAADRMLSVVNVAVCAQAKRFSRLSARAAEHCVPSENHRRCDLCNSPSSSVGATTECAGCRRRACRRCHSRRPVFRLHPRTRRPEADPFCRECVDLVARASGGVHGFRRGRGYVGPEDADGTADERSGSGSSGHEETWRRQQPGRTRSSSLDDGANLSADAQWDLPQRQRAHTDAKGPSGSADDAAVNPRAGRSQSLLFDPERQMYIRVFDAAGRATDAGPPPQTPPQPPQVRPQPPQVRPQPGNARRRPVSGPRGGRGQRDRVFSVDALD